MVESGAVGVSCDKDDYHRILAPFATHHCPKAALQTRGDSTVITGIGFTGPMRVDQYALLTG
jgi:hypothetical protein